MTSEIFPVSYFLQEGRKMTVKDRYEKTIQDIEEWAKDPFLRSQAIAEKVARANAVNLRDMSAIIGYMTGSTLRGYINERKMMASYLNLIQANKCDIQQALAIAGYSDQANYTRAFKAQFGMTF